ncbi:MAG: TolC family protein [Pseudomonadota bacterium]
MIEFAVIEAGFMVIYLLPLRHARAFIERLGALVCLALAFTAGANSDPVNIAVLNDGPVERTFVANDLIKEEIEAVLGKEFSAQFPDHLVRDGGWNINSIRDALRALMRDPEVDIILTSGLIATHVAAHLEGLSKPVIGIVVADSVLQEFPRQGNASGKRNFVYLADDHTVGQDLDLFHRLIGFKQLTIVPDRLVLDAIPELPTLIEEAAQRLDVTIDVAMASDSAAQVLERMPPATEAVYLPPLSRFSDVEVARLMEGLNARGIATFALTGQPYMSAGALMTGSGRNVDYTRVARRIALNVQSILLGTAAEDLKVDLSQTQKLAINMVTARAIGYSPRWQDLEGSIVIDEVSADTADALDLVGALELALANNPALKVSEFNPLIAQTSADAARAGLLPQISTGFSATKIDSDRANPLSAAERSGEISGQASQLVYSERVWSGYTVAKLLREAEDHALKVVALDTLEQTAIAYLNLLQAQAQAQVRGSNVLVTESNLELAQSRERVGQSGRADVLRFRSELAIDRQNLYAALGEVDTAAVELKRLLGRPVSDEVNVGDSGIPRLIDLFSEARYQRLFNNELRWNLFREFHIDQALAHAPELQQIDALTAGAERQLLAARRAYYVPDVNVVGQATTRILRGGAGSGLSGTGLDDDQWAVGVEATLPLFLGGERQAAKDEATYTLSQTRFQRTQFEIDIQARVMAALERSGASFPAIRLSKEAAVAARDNLELVTDGYSAGAATITELNDAQDAALTAELAVAQARYQFIINFVGVLRGMASFDILLAPDGLNEWYESINAFFEAAGVGSS